ncbi:hypothetical protein ACWEFL_15845 [Streptomyces sp. NPDC004838]
MTACTICTFGTAPDGLHACHPCLYALRHNLGEIPRLERLLADELAPAGGPGQGRIGAARTGRPPVRIDVLNLLGPGHDQPPDAETDATGPIPIRALLVGWAGYIAYTYRTVLREPDGTVLLDHRGRPHIRRCTAAHTRGTGTTAWCQWLTAYLPYTATHPEIIAELHHQIRDLTDLLHRLTGTEPERHHKNAPCPKCGQFTLVRDDGHFHIHCTRCRLRLTPDQYATHATATQNETPDP